MGQSVGTGPAGVAHRVLDHRQAALGPAVGCPRERIGSDLSPSFVHDLLARHTAGSVRRFLLERHYREDWEFHQAELERPASRMPGAAGERPRGAELKARFLEALDRDLDTPQALRCLDLARGSEDEAGGELVEAGSAILGLVPRP